MLLGSAYGKVSLDTSGVATGVMNAVNAVKSLKSSFELLNGGLNTLKANFASASGAVAGARAELERLKIDSAVAIKPANDNLRQMQENAKAAKAAVATAREELQKVRAAGGDVKPASENLKQAQQNAKAAALAVENARQELEKIKASGAAGVQAAADNLKKLETNAAAAGKALNGAQGQLQQLSQVGMKVGQTMQDVGQILMVAVTLPLMVAAGAATKVATDFSISMNVLKGASNATGEQLEDLRNKAKELGADLTLPGTSASDAAEAMAELAKAGLNVNDVLAAAKGVLQMSAAGQLGNAEAATIAANALNIFKLKAEETVRVADLLAAGANSSSADVRQMADSLQMSGSVAASAGMKIEELVTAISIMANAGIQGSDAGTSLKQMLLSLQAPAAPVIGEMTKFGLSVYDAAGNMKSMRDIIEEFSTKLKGATQEERNFALAKIFGSDAVRAANIVLMGGVDAYDKMSKSVTKTGAAADMAKTMMEGLAGAFENVKSAGETALLAAFEPFEPIVIDGLNALAKLFSTFAELPEPVRAFIVTQLILFAALGPVLAILGKIIFTFAGLAQAWPILTAGAKAFGIALPAIGTGASGAATTVSGTLVPALGGISPFITGTVIPAITGFVTWLSTSAFVAALPAIGILVAAWMTDFLGFRTNLQNMAKQIPVILKYEWDYMGAQLQAFFTNLGRNLLRWMVESMLSYMGWVQAVADAIKKIFTDGLDMHSPSRVFQYYGKMSMAGYVAGFKEINPADLARAVAAPARNMSTSQQYTQVQNFGGGLSIRAARKMQAEQEERMYRNMAKAFA